MEHACRVQHLTSSGQTFESYVYVECTPACPANQVAHSADSVHRHDRLRWLLLPSGWVFTLSLFLSNAVLTVHFIAVETEAGAVTLAQLTDIYYRNLGALNVAPSATDLNEQTVTALLMGFLWKPVRLVS